MFAGVSLEQAPPLSVPVRFFLTAPLFGLTAALLLILQPELLASRWSPGMLALTHATVLGVFATVMIGALQQMLPVVAGAVIPQPRRVAGVIHPLWTLGVALLVAAFLWPDPRLFWVALSLIAAALLCFIGAVFFSLRRAPSISDSVPGIKLAVFALLLTLASGVILGLGHLGALPLWRPWLTNLHLAWGLLGWIAMLIITIAWQVVPMFQITPPYPLWLRRTSAPALTVLLLLKTLLALLANHSGDAPYPILSTAIDLLLAGVLLCFALATLQLQRKAKRKIRDSHRDYWRLAIVMLITAVLAWGASEISGLSQLSLVAVVLLLAGFGLSILTGMLLKIVAFLVWFHLSGLNSQRMMAGEAPINVPHMNAVIPQQHSRRLLFLLLGAQAGTLLALFWPGLPGRLAGLLWFGFFACLAGVLASALNRYRQVTTELEQ